MRDYALSRAAAVEGTGIAGLLGTLIRNWIARRSVARLSQLDDYMLRDIGITRDEIAWASRLPLSQNAALELEERALKRRGRHG